MAEITAFFTIREFLNNLEQHKNQVDVNGKSFSWNYLDDEASQKSGKLLMSLKSWENWQDLTANRLRGEKVVLIRCLEDWEICNCGFDCSSLKKLLRFDIFLKGEQWNFWKFTNDVIEKWG
jgi:hypothetical protein